MSYAGLGTSAAYKRYWNKYADSCSEFGDEGACLNRAIQHGASVTFAGLGQVAPASAATTQQALAIAANLTQIGAQVVSNPDLFARSQAPRIVNALDEAVVTPLVDRMAQRATPYFVRYVLPPIALLYVISGLAAFYSYESLKALGGRRVSANRRRRRRRH